MTESACKECFKSYTDIVNKSIISNRGLCENCYIKWTRDRDKQYVENAKGGNRRRKRRFFFSKREFIKLRNLGLSFQEIGDKYGCSHTTIIHTFKRYGLSTKRVNKKSQKGLIA